MVQTSRQPQPQRQQFHTQTSNRCRCRALIQGVKVLLSSKHLLLIKIWSNCLRKECKILFSRLQAPQMRAAQIQGLTSLVQRLLLSNQKTKSRPFPNYSLRLRPKELSKKVHWFLRSLSKKSQIKSLISTKKHYYDREQRHLLPSILHLRHLTKSQNTKVKTKIKTRTKMELKVLTAEFKFKGATSRSLRLQYRKLVNRHQT